MLLTRKVKWALFDNSFEIPQYLLGFSAEIETASSPDAMY